jgi:hypothetical protein
MPRVARRLLRGVMLSLGAFVMFFLVAGAALPCRRPRSAYVMAAGAAMAVGAVQLIFTRTFAARCPIGRHAGPGQHAAAATQVGGRSRSVRDDPAVGSG